MASHLQDGNGDMHITLTACVALGGGALLAIWGLPAQLVRFWLDWGRKLAALYLLGYFVMGALAGLLGYAIATLLHWKPTDSEWLNGIIFAAGGHAVARANGAQFNASDANEAGSLLGLGTRWFENQLNDLAEARIAKWLQSQQEFEVARIARQLLGRILGRYSIEQAEDGALSPEDARTATLLNQRLQDLARESDTEKREVLSQGLIQFCKEEFCARRLSRA